MKKLSILWVLIILSGHYYAGCFSCIEEERIGLLKMKSRIVHSDQYDPISSWVDDENSDCCGWKYVTCDNNTRRVIRLDRLGILPIYSPEIILDLRSLKELQVLILRFNNFNNTRIFKYLSALTSLTVIDLAYAQINGSFSDPGRELCKLKNLKELYLGFNHLSGSIPACFSNLTSLKALDLSHNDLVGNLDPSLLVSLTKLEYFSLSANLGLDGNLMFNSLVSSHRKSRFKYLGLLNCNINISTIDLAKFLHNHDNLILFDLSHNKLHGEFSNLLFENNSKLKSLNLQNNSLTGHIHFPFGPLLNLEWLQLSHNHIQGELQPNIGEVLPQLRQLKIANNVLRGEIPISVFDIISLQKLDLSNNNLSGKIPERLDLSCKRLSWILLSNNKLEGRIPDTLFNLTMLSIVDLSNNQFTGYIPSNIFQYRTLGLLDISQNYISGKIPRSLANFTYSFQTLAMHDNSIEGYIPPELCNLTRIRSLDLSQNQLSGHMPSCLITLPNLTSLRLQHNKLTLPNTLPLNTSGLLTLDLSHNNLSEKIPNWFGFLGELRVLLLKGNRFSGSIPHELCRLDKIDIMDLSYNNLSGSIPLCITNIAFGRIGIYKELRFTGIWIRFLEFLLVENVFPDLIVQPYLDDYDISLETVFYQEDVDFMTKNRSNSYKGDIINFMSGLDLSCNQLKGNIPFDIGALTDLRALNLSHNQFTGVIPPSLSNMKQIESIDISHNKLSGEIPSSLTRLYFLVTFTVAYNNLSGRLPEMVAQFSTFEEASYEGNPFLCGPPLLRRQCKINADQGTITDTLAGRNDVFGIDPISFLASFVATYVTCLLAFVIVLCINPYWRRRWFYFIDTCLSFVFPSWY